MSWGPWVSSFWGWSWVPLPSSCSPAASWLERWAAPPWVPRGSLGATRLKEIRETRRRLLEEELEATNVRAERMVFLLDRQDRLRPVAGSIARGLGIVAGAFLTLLAGGLTLGGLVYQSGPLLFLGSIATVFPLAAWASYSVRFQEADLVNRHLMKCEDEVAGLPAAGPSGSTARGTEGSS